MPARDPEERRQIARLGGLSLHAQVDSRKHTQPARAAFDARFELEVDPRGELEPTERARRAAIAKRAYFTRLALASAKARRRAVS